jgi:hypothetical protein
VGCDLRKISAQTHQRQKSPFAVRNLQAPPANSADEQSENEYDKPEQRTKYGRTINKPEHFSSIQTTASGTRNRSKIHRSNFYVFKKSQSSLGLTDRLLTY